MPFSISVFKRQSHGHPSWHCRLRRATHVNGPRCVPKMGFKKLGSSPNNLAKLCVRNHPGRGRLFRKPFISTSASGYRWWCDSVVVNAGFWGRHGSSDRLLSLTLFLEKHVCSLLRTLAAGAEGLTDCSVGVDVKEEICRFVGWLAVLIWGQGCQLALLWTPGEQRKKQQYVEVKIEKAMAPASMQTRIR